MEQQKYGDSRAGRDGGLASEIEEPMIGRAAQGDGGWGQRRGHGTCRPPTHPGTRETEEHWARPATEMQRVTSSEEGGSSRKQLLEAAAFSA